MNQRMTQNVNRQIDLSSALQCKGTIIIHKNSYQGHCPDIPIFTAHAVKEIEKDRISTGMLVECPSVPLNA